MYPWPLGEFDNVIDVALEIAMDYLDRPGRPSGSTRFNRLSNECCIKTSARVELKSFERNSLTVQQDSRSLSSRGTVIGGVPCGMNSLRKASSP
jgi:hypothetical protein